MQKKQLDIQNPSFRVQQFKPNWVFIGAEMIETCWQTSNVTVIAKDSFKKNPKYRVCQSSSLQASDSFHEDLKYGVSQSISVHVFHILFESEHHALESFQ